jgi:hypothetical protein
MEGGGWGRDRPLECPVALGRGGEGQGFFLGLDIFFKTIGFRHCFCHYLQEEEHVQLIYMFVEL